MLLIPWYKEKHTLPLGRCSLAQGHGLVREILMSVLVPINVPGQASLCNTPSIHSYQVALSLGSLKNITL